MARLVSALFAAAVALGAASAAARADLQEGINAYYDGNYAAALEKLQPEADGGDVIAQYFLGEMYLHGKGVGQDFDQAVAWYSRAAEHGHPQAQAALGSLQMLGLGGPRDTTNGYFWLIVSVVWTKSDLRQDAMSALGQVAVQLSPEQKSAIARVAVPEWKASQ